MRRLEILERKYEKLAHKMKPGGGRPKGNAFERIVGKKVVRAFKKAGFSVDDTDCYRTPSSGGHRYAKHEDPGDLVISKRLRKVFPFSVECKDQKSLEISRFLLPMNTHKASWPEHQFLAQCVEAAKLKKKLTPLLVFKTQSRIYCAFPSPIIYWPPCLTFKHPDCFGKDSSWQLLLFSRFLRNWSKLQVRISPKLVKGKK